MYYILLQIFSTKKMEEMISISSIFIFSFIS